MTTFHDTRGRAWDLRLTIGTARRVQDATGVNLLEPEVGDPPLLTRLGTDEMLLARVICAMLGDQFERYDLDEAAVYDAFDGKTILAAQDAFYEELIDFFRQRGRATRASAVERQRTLLAKADRAGEARIERIDLDGVVDSAMSRAESGGMSGCSPEPPG